MFNRRTRKHLRGLALGMSVSVCPALDGIAKREGAKIYGFPTGERLPHCESSALGKTLDRSAAYVHTTGGVQAC